jgi:hypothetical protein
MSTMKNHISNAYSPGTGVQRADRTVQNSEKEPPEFKATVCPTDRVDTPGPTAAITPQPSAPSRIKSLDPPKLLSL